MEMNGPNESSLIKQYFNRGYEYQEILHFLDAHHGIKISLSTVLRRLRNLGLKRRNKGNMETLVRAADFIYENLQSPGSSNGYRSTWDRLKNGGIQVSRSDVRILLSTMDPEGTTSRRRNRLTRRTYANPGPDFAWHVDGHDKLKPFGFPIHGAVDGYSRKVMWLRVVRSNNCPKIIASLFLDSVKNHNGCPRQLVTDAGTENALIAAIQSYFWQDTKAHRYVPSPGNQRIEG